LEDNPSIDHQLRVFEVYEAGLPALGRHHRDDLRAPLDIRVGKTKPGDGFSIVAQL
jgi:hypothetical protein